jgi:hypothetical protein
MNIAQESLPKKRGRPSKLAAHVPEKKKKAKTVVQITKKK